MSCGLDNFNSPSCLLQMKTKLPLLLPMLSWCFSTPLTLPFVAYILISFATLLLEVPTVRLIEGSICNRYYVSAENATLMTAEQVNESACKIPQVQSLLAKLVGWKFSFDAVPGFQLQFS